MNRETRIWTIVMIVGAVGLLANGLLRGAGSAYVEETPHEFVRVVDGAAPGQATWMPIDEARAQGLTDLPAAGSAEHRAWTSVAAATQRRFAEATAADPAQTRYRFSWSRTLGVWTAGLFTLFIFSFLVRDNPLYKVAEAIVVGVSAGYWMVIGFWDVLVPNLFGKLMPGIVQSWAMPGLDADTDWSYLAPLILGVMLLWRLAPSGTWIARWPLAFIVGTTAGLRLLAFLHGDFLAQIKNSIVPLWVTDAATGGFDFWGSLRSLVLVVGVLSSLVYFFFSFEHKGTVGKIAKLGIWFLMITFGAAFGYTVMGRIALLAIRFEFIFDDWFWLIDPTAQRLLP